MVNINPVIHVWTVTLLVLLVPQVQQMIALIAKFRGERQKNYIKTVPYVILIVQQGIIKARLPRKILARFVQTTA